MHNYQPAIELETSFVPDNCSAAVGDVITFGAGQEFEGIYEFAHSQMSVLLEVVLSVWELHRLSRPEGRDCGMSSTCAYLTAPPLSRRLSTQYGRLRMIQWILYERSLRILGHIKTRRTRLKRIRLQHFGARRITTFCCRLRRILTPKTSSQFTKGWDEMTRMQDTAVIWT
jgi:hypothetical protein